MSFNLIVIRVARSLSPSFTAVFVQQKGETHPPRLLGTTLAQASRFHDFESVFGITYAPRYVIAQRQTFIHLRWLIHERIAVLWTKRVMVSKCRSNLWRHFLSAFHLDKVVLHDVQHLAPDGDLADDLQAGGRHNRRRLSLMHFRQYAHRDTV